MNLADLRNVPKASVEVDRVPGGFAITYRGPRRIRRTILNAGQAGQYRPLSDRVNGPTR